jgi:hypothetical protein
MGLELGAKPPFALLVEVAMAVAAAALYFGWARSRRPSTRWYVGPVVATGLLAVLWGHNIRSQVRIVLSGGLFRLRATA